MKPYLYFLAVSGKLAALLLLHMLAWTLVNVKFHQQCNDDVFFFFKTYDFAYFGHYDVFPQQIQIFNTQGSPWLLWTFPFNLTKENRITLVFFTKMEHLSNRSTNICIRKKGKNLFGIKLWIAFIKKICTVSGVSFFYIYSLVSFGRIHKD